MSKYENSESNSSGQNRESRRNFAAAVEGRTMTRFQSGSIALRLIPTVHASYFKQQLIATY